MLPTNRMLPLTEWYDSYPHFFDGMICRNLYLKTYLLFLLHFYNSSKREIIDDI
jgi:hypothetical protein